MALPAPRDGATALVTGASSGIGTEIARGLASRGYGLTLVARREDRLVDLAAALTAQHAVPAGVIACDLGERSGRDKLATELEKLELDVSILVNNAGFGYTGDFVPAGRERQVSMVALNCEAVVDLSSRYLSEMVKRGEGAVVNIASVAAFQPLAGSATYAATKAFVLNFSEAVHQELNGTGVTVTAVSPGPVRSEFAEQAGIGGAEERTPGMIWMSAGDVAEEAIDAADKGKRAVVPGRMNQATSIIGRHTPRRLALPISRRIWQQVE